MRSFQDLPAIILGFAAYLAIVGWLLLLPLFAFIALSIVGVEPPYGSTASGSLAHQLLRGAAFFAAGYVTGRSADESPSIRAAVLGVTIYLFITLFNRVLWTMFALSVPVDPTSEAFAFVSVVLAATVGGTAAQWHRTVRGASQLQWTRLSRKAQVWLVVLSIAPFAFLAASYRP